MNYYNYRDRLWAYREGINYIIPSTKTQIRPRVSWPGGVNRSMPDSNLLKGG